MLAREFFQSTPATGKKGLPHKYTLNMCLYFTALFLFHILYFYTSILPCKKKEQKKTLRTLLFGKPCKSNFGNFHIYTIQNDYIVHRGFCRLTDIYVSEILS